jgi:hypothetical protein
LIASDLVPEGELIDRAFLSIQFWGYGVATDCATMREEVFRLREIRASKKQLESVVGELREAIYWNP